jgi:hypothetical protein
VVRAETDHAAFAEHGHEGVDAWAVAQDGHHFEALEYHDCSFQLHCTPPRGPMQR